MNSKEPSFSRTTGALLVFESLLFIAIALIAHPGVLARVFSLDLDSLESMQVRYIQVGFLCIGFMTLLWGFYEVLFRKPGPLTLLSILCLFPLFVPFSFLG